MIMVFKIFFNKFLTIYNILLYKYNYALKLQPLLITVNFEWKFLLNILSTSIVAG